MPRSFHGTGYGACFCVLSPPGTPQWRVIGIGCAQRCLPTYENSRCHNSQILLAPQSRLEMASHTHLELPHGTTAVKVCLINPVNFGPAQIHRFMAPPVPGLETLKSSPSHSFLVEHPSGRKIVFDLGIRKDYLNYSNAIAEYIPTTNYDIQVSQNVADILQENEIDLSSIEAIVWSHWHWE